MWNPISLPCQSRLITQGALVGGRFEDGVEPMSSPVAHDIFGNAVKEGALICLAILGPRSARGITKGTSLA
jgi:hypothetical protein